MVDSVVSVTTQGGHISAVDAMDDLEHGSIAGLHGSVGRDKVLFFFFFFFLFFFFFCLTFATGKATLAAVGGLVVGAAVVGATDVGSSDGRGVGKEVGNEVVGSCVVGCVVGAREGAAVS